MERAQGWTAYLDESFQESDTGAGFYVLAAATFAPGVLEDVRGVVLGLRGQRKVAKLHWSQMEHRERIEAAKRLGDASGAHLVAVAAPVAMRRQERARALCLTEMVVELHGRGVASIVAESREETLDRRDVDTVRHARHRLPAGSRAHISHERGPAEPVLWAADIVAGAVRMDREGDASARRHLDAQLEVITIDL